MDSFEYRLIIIAREINEDAKINFQETTSEISRCNEDSRAFLSQ